MTMTISGKFYTSWEIQRLLGISKQRVSELSSTHRWQSHRVGVVYHADDVTKYLWSRWRRDLAREFGVTVNGLVTHDEWDRSDNCPECGAFAIWRPATLEEIQDTYIEIYSNNWPWLCVNGHSKGGG